MAVVVVMVSVTGYVILSGQDSAKTYSQENALLIPTLIDSREAGNNVELVIQENEHEFFSGVKSETKGFSQSYLGPTIRFYKGETTRISFRSEIDEPTTVHGHGLHVDGNVDGGPQGEILPGDTKDVVLPIVQEAGTSWYHPHFEAKTADHVHAGLAGLYLIEDENSQTLPLPKEYGINDIPLVVQDRSFVDGKMQPYAGDKCSAYGWVQRRDFGGQRDHQCASHCASWLGASAIAQWFKCAILSILFLLMICPSIRLPLKVDF